MRHARTPRTTRSVVGALAATSLLLAACGDDDDDSSSTEAPSESDAPVATEAPDTTDAPADTEAPDTTDAPADTEAPDDTEAPAASDGEDHADDAPERVVSLSPTHTEIMFAIGAGDLLVAVDDQSDYPADVSALPNDLSGYEPNVEAIAGYEPDLVLIGGDFTGLGDQLDALEIGWWDGPAAITLDDTYAQIEQLGDVTGHQDEADELIASMQAEIDEIVAATPIPSEPLAIYHELDPTLYSADSTTFIGALYGMLGLQNIADRAEGDTGGYPQLNAEFIVSADPDMIFLADTECCGESAETVAARPGWDVIVAVQNGDVIEMSDDIASRWGPRVVDYLAAVSAAVQAAGQPA